MQIVCAQVTLSSIARLSGIWICATRRSRSARLRAAVFWLILSALPLVGHAETDGVLAAQDGVIQPGDWPNYGNDAGGMRFSSLKQINRKNVSKLKTAWIYHTGDISDGHDRPRSGFETTPLLLDDTLFLTTPFKRVIALEPSTGRQRWVFDPKIDQGWQSGDGLVNRGLATCAI
jgi:glucose dehydrogenase